ncbi:MAG: acyloxyacyl hydrolase [Vicinamibacterales bacterium]
MPASPVRPCLLLLLLCSLPALAAAQSPAAGVQTPTPATDLADGATEWTAVASHSWGVEIAHSTSGQRYVRQALTWGHVLSGPHGPGPLRGHFSWGIAVTPVFLIYEPGSAYGVGVSPISWRWSFAARGRVLPYAELNGGLLFTDTPVPDETTRVNFTAHAAAGVRIMISRAQGLVVGYELHHVSNGNRLERNPGINGHSVFAGWTVFRR